MYRGSERLVARGVRSLGAVSRWHPDAFLLAARHSGRMLTAAGPRAAVVMIIDAYERVPAYRRFLDARGGLPPRLRGQSTQEWLATVPTTSKSNYIDAYPMLDRCWDGRLPARGVEIDESAGSSGAPYQWVRSTDELHEVHRTLELLAGYLLDHGPRADPDRRLITINAFSMGAWATGTNVSAALKRKGVLKSCGPDVQKILAVLTLFGPTPRYILCGYPPFLETVADAARVAGIDLAGYDITGFVGGEGMSEGLRDRLQHHYMQVWSAYGASDLDIGVAAETPLAVWLRRAATGDAELAQALFGSTARVPMCFQYDPSTYHLETTDGPHGVELVATVLRPTLSPRLRYTVGDAGGVVPLAEGLRLAAVHGHAPTEDGGVDPAWGRPLDLPFVYVHGRADSTVSYMGANLYPEDVAAGIDDGRGPASAAGVTPGAFFLELVDEDDPRPCVHVELERSEPGADPAAAVDALVVAIRARLAHNSADYRAALTEDPRAARLEVRLHPAGTGPFAGNSSRIKRRYVVSGAVLPVVEPPTLEELLPPAHRATLTAALRAPSAHNAQPWRLTWLRDADEPAEPDSPQTYALRYDHHDYLPSDPDDRDGYLCMGALAETLALAAVRNGLEAEFENVFARTGTVLDVVRITLRPRRGEVDAATRRLATYAADRHTNRSEYTDEPLPAALVEQLEALGCALVDPRELSRLSTRASALSWRDRRFVSDLRRWVFFDENEPRGMTPRGLMLARYETAGLRGALAVGRLPGALGRLFASRDTRLVRSAPAVAVLGADSLEPADLFEAGRRLLRAWSLVCGSGHATHPVSVSVDRPETAPAVAALSGIAVPAAVFRGGRPTRPPRRSKPVRLGAVQE
jgi:phenylacetate-CoA ligase